MQPVPAALLDQPRFLDLEEYFNAEPLNFQLFYTNQQTNKADVFNTIYLEDGNKPVQIDLELFNESSHAVTLRKPTDPDVGAGPNQFHFAIRFEKELNLNPAGISLSETTSTSWVANIQDEAKSNFFIIYFLHKSGLTLAKKGQAQDRIVLGLEGLTARNQFIKSSNLAMLYGQGSLTVNGDGPSGEFGELVFCPKTITITNHPDKKYFPLQYRFVGPNTILNDGTTPNTLTIQLVNHPPTRARPILALDRGQTKFILSFKTGSSITDLTSDYWVNNVQITCASTDWKIPTKTSDLQWTLELQPNNNETYLQLKYGDTIQLQIDNMVTGNDSGVTYLSIAYQNIPGYPDGQLLLPIEKTPLLYRDTIINDKVHRNVGIGTTKPKAKLEVVGGNIKLASANCGIEFAGATIYNDLTNQLRIKPAENKTIAFQTSAGNTAFELGVDGKLKIPNGLSGNLLLTGDILGGSDRMLRIYPNTDAANSRAWIEMWGDTTGSESRSGELSLAGTYVDFRCNSTTSSTGYSAMRLSQEGNLGIGTKEPKGRLHVNGDIYGRGFLWLNSDNGEGYSGTAYVQARDKSGKSHISLCFRTQRSGKYFDAMTLTSDGKVAIGYPYAKEKLHVDGDYYGRGHIYLYAFEGDNMDGTAYVQARDKSLLTSIGLLFRTQLKGDVVDVMRFTPDGNISIGGNKQLGKVHIGGYKGYTDPGQKYRTIREPNITHGNDDKEQLVSLYAEHRIQSPSFNAFSDARIKDIQGRSDGASDLRTLLQIEITDYSYKDKAAHGNGQYKKVIGQQVADVFPQAVDTHTDVIPDLFKLTSIAKGWVELPAHGLQPGERVQVFIDSNQPQLHTVTAVTPDSFQIPSSFEGDVFVYGREVSDFHVVDYDALSMLHVSATQELWQMVNALKLDVQQLKAQLNGNHQPAVSVAASPLDKETSLSR